MKNENTKTNENENVEVVAAENTAETTENTAVNKKTATKVAKKTIVIPATEGDKDTFVPVCINGNITQIQKGVEVEVENEVYELLKRGGYLGIK